MRSVASWLGAAVIAIEFAAAPGAMAATDLVATVNWTAPTGMAGTVLFQGSADDAGALTGRAYAGNDQLIVAGTIGDGGAVSGTLSFDDGTTVSVVGNFSATLDANHQLQGAYIVFTTSGSWSAPADKMPVPADPGGRS